MASIGDRIRKIRIDNGITQEKFAEELEVSKHTISRWENDESYPDAEQIGIIIEKYKVTADFLVLGKENEEAVQENKKTVLKKNTDDVFYKIIRASIIILFAFLTLLWIMSYSIARIKCEISNGYIYDYFLINLYELLFIVCIIFWIYLVIILIHY